ncbi:MAG: motility associated factor glycosyltransferase family protein [Lachnospiraceae bacterium]|nr:motility associated factor glycosyltransferase family protein [Lachnospiraceae bacterium]
MNQTELRELFWNTNEAINRVNDLVDLVRVQNEHGLSILMPYVGKSVKMALEQVMLNLDFLLENGITWDAEYVLSVLTEIENAQVSGDTILMGDLYELQMLPILCDVQAVISNMGIELAKEQWFEQNMEVLQKRDEELWKLLMEFRKNEENYAEDESNIQCMVEPTGVGAFTMALQMGNRRWYLHSNKDPVAEAKAFAKRMYSVEKEKYLLFGWGMGYHVRELWKLYTDMDLVVVEPNLSVLYYSLSNGDWTDILSHVKIITEYEKMPLKEGRELILYRPELATIQENGIREQLENIANRKDSIEDFKLIFPQNTRANIKNCSGYVDELQETIRGKKVIIVAGGPSLDKNLHYLKECPQDVVVIAVGTVFKLLLREGIHMDYVVVSDAFIYPQIQGEEQRDIPIMILATADRRVAQNYQGPKYLVCQKGYNLATEYAENHHYMCYNSGGSVATLALDIAIRLQAESIAFIGLDLAYYGTQAHASGTAQETFAGYEMRKVQGMDGTELNASLVFIQYREWMERRITEADAGMKVVDATEGGALKKGFVNMTLQEYLHM